MVMNFPQPPGSQLRNHLHSAKPYVAQCRTVKFDDGKQSIKLPQSLPRKICAVFCRRARS